MCIRDSPNIPSDVIELVERRRIQHTDLVDDQRLAGQPALLRFIGRGHVSRQVRGTFTGVSDAREGVDRLPADLRGRGARRGRHEDAAADALRRSNSFLEREGLARALRVYNECAATDAVLAFITLSCSRSATGRDIHRTYLGQSMRRSFEW